MINLETIARKIDSVLNGTDTEIPSGLVSPANDNYFFNVYSAGLFLSQLNDMNSGKNFIPVIVGAYGGENNPVADLGEQDRNVLIQLLFPVRFKQEMYALEEFLDNVFVGKLLTFGTQQAVCNVSPAQYGELQDFSFNEFNQWVVNTYKQPINKIETYMSMEINLYLSTAKNVGASGGFVYGNSYNFSFSIGSMSNSTFTANMSDNNPVFVEQTDTAHISPASQQLLGGSYSMGLGQATAFGKSITVYVKNDTNYAWLINRYLNKNIQDLVVKIEESIDISSGISISNYYYITDMVLSKKKGELMTLTFTLGDWLDLED